ncbi:aspartyl/glutamyl-tRNA(Asn/Gln) amidotransferase subunit B [Pyrenophora tritici-repentis Pt-1C-BFP]|uniref:Aspartyl/glutamyl-tRNA(Asn/Gln) amidotransferase subunit B n=1 Tax=Pyrenophora tritici-repentis (strain Pt-1C-BFP) TaxID=426418 RepID=B2VVF5_PYRTR|nr:aspartyl/glutamyl-tRNA(Asn/Gln) amidotransferase subunit B [Pyrenophora tritici-repentis Pt-1C-BFP]EDU41708.1 aspartyl/glutamyl-tRNA(Asn/Gln) amidotransferase subunit B [Pyrenophora tritici-repentis Pt-1C-BFP]
MLARTTRASFAAASKRPYIYHSCTKQARRSELGAAHLTSHTTRYLQTETSTSFRKTLKDAAKEQKKVKKKNKGQSDKTLDPITLNKHARTEKWELTVGIEVHAELNTARKLFSKATTSVGDAPNTHAALFDVAFPGSQPIFQLDTLVPALRAALAFQCEIPPRSSFDRKHYFYQDQPNGYQITQYYEPFAKNGRLVLYPYDFPPDKTPQHTPKYIGIKQIQMEQDTAKTIQQPPSTHLLDFNRVSHPLIEIITMPEIHDPIVAAATARKIQMILKAVNACTTGQRTEIKNLSSFKAVEDAIIAERDRQIDILESGGIIEGETRGWTLGSTTTKRLRSKEGEIDYRYMPDPDIAPIIVSDANDGERMEYFLATITKLSEEWGDEASKTKSRLGKMVGDWVLMELGSMFKQLPWDANRVPPNYLADVISHVYRKVITSPTGKRLLAMKFEGDERSVAEIVKEENLALHPLSEEEYREMAQTLLERNPEMVMDIIRKGQTKKISWFVGQMMAEAPKGSMEPNKAKEVLEALLGLDGKVY